MKALILCGGQGLRIKGNFGETPKPLVMVKGRPIVAHIIDHYRAFGVTELILLVGDNESEFHKFAGSYAESDCTIRVLQTGSLTPTGGRLFQALSLLGDDEVVFATYGDGISDVDIASLLDTHRASGKKVTLTAVHPMLPFGLLLLNDGNEVVSFREKPIMDQWTNGGFFVIDRSVLEGMNTELDFETQVLPELALEGELGVYCHRGFWKSMDTYKDYLELNASEA